ncbi:MAG: hypothetical protein JW833_04790 [Prolixibacteraceae bacterium]|nr:hypothetical protein [Prolixibacteraceae bacterium]
MRNRLPLILLILTNSLFAQQKFEEKIGIGFSKLFSNDVIAKEFSKTKLNSVADLSIGISLYDKTKSFTFRKELETELFLYKGSMSIWSLGTACYRKNLKGYSLLIKAKILPQIRLKHSNFIAFGPVIGKNIKAHWSYDYSTWDTEPVNIVSWHASESATDLFSKFFWGIEVCMGGYKYLSDKQYFGWELGLLYYNNFYNHWGSFNRYGFWISILNPTGFLKQKKEF